MSAGNVGYTQLATIHKSMLDSMDNLGIDISNLPEIVAKLCLSTFTLSNEVIPEKHTVLKLLASSPEGRIFSLVIEVEEATHEDVVTH
jgi:hypothetical protein